MSGTTEPQLSSTRFLHGISFRIPLVWQIALAVAIGTLLGILFGTDPYIPGTQFGNADLGALTMLVTTLLKAFAAPLIFFAVLDAFIRTEITWERCGRLLLFSGQNVIVAMAIGLCVMNVWRPGEAWTDQLAQKITSPASVSERSTGTTSSPASLPARDMSKRPPSRLVESITLMVPTNVVGSFTEENLMRLIVLALLIGAGFRVVRRNQMATDERAYEAFEQGVATMFQILLQVLDWIVRLVPLAVCGALAKSVSETGADVFRLVGIFLAAMLVGLTLHAGVYYTLVAWLFGGKNPRLFLGKGFRAVLTGLSTNSSLATVPVTLHVLTEEMGVSDQSARLSACVGTNFNNDGITLYEAMTAIFLAQAIGLPLSLGAQIGVVGTAVLASLGAAGIPQGGLAVLPLVLASTGLSPQTIATALPLIMTVDWIIARFRSGVNVMGDMTVAIQLDRSNSRTRD